MRVQINSTEIYYNGHLAFKEGVGDFGEINNKAEEDGCFEILMDSGNILYFTEDHFDVVEE